MLYMYWKYLVYKSNARRPSLLIVGKSESHKKKKNIGFQCKMMPGQEKGFPPLPYILNVRFFQLQIPNKY